MRKQRLLTGIGVSFGGLVLLIAGFIAYQTMGRNTYAVYGVVDASDCASPYEKTPRVKMRFLVSAADASVVVRYTLSDGKKGFSQLDNCTVRDKQNWQCGGRSAPDQTMVTASYVMRDGVLSYSLPQEAQLKACPAHIQME